jgi:hypothetical protein
MTACGQQSSVMIFMAFLCGTLFSSSGVRTHEEIRHGFRLKRPILPRQAQNMHFTWPDFLRGTTGDAHSQVADNYFVEKDTDKRIRTYYSTILLSKGRRGHALTD